MLKSLPQLGSVLVLLFFIFLVFGILGVHLFAGLQVGGASSKVEMT